jgi:hypothetical protein
MAWSAAMVAFVAAIPLWRFTRYTITVAHEGGHAFFAEWVLWLSLALLAALLLKVRNPFAVVPVLATGVVIYWVARHAEPSAQLVFAYIWVWFLLIGGVRQISTLFWVTHEQQRGSDAAVMERLTWLPDVFWLAVFWLAVFWLGTLGALVWGGSLLLRHTV